MAHSRALVRGAGRAPRTSAALTWMCLLLLWRGVAAVSPASSRILEEVEMSAAESAPTSPAKLDAQGAALLEFAAGLSDPHESLVLWHAGSHPCGAGGNRSLPWPGVACDSQLGSIISLDISSRGLAGQIGGSLAALDALRSIDLHNNSLSGDLPAAWGALQLLDTVDLSSNALDGTLPPAYGGLGALQHFDASRNHLHGELPAAWSGMTLLEVLDLSHNSLTSSLPESWGRLAFLSSLNLRNNSLNGSLPAAWAAQAHLLQLDVADNQLNGPLPEEWAQGMDSLRAANLSNNGITGGLPERWANLTMLQALDIGANKLSGKIPSTWRAMPLHSLQVGQNDGVCGGVPAGVSSALDGGAATGLNNSCPWDGDADTLLAFKASLTDPIGALASWQPGTNPCDATRPWEGVGCDADGRVNAVSVERRRLRGRVTGALAGVERLSVISFPGNDLFGTLPPEWARQPRLIEINVSGNALEGELPAAWAALVALRRLDASGNGGLNGTLPASWGQLPALQELNLRGNVLVGTLPASWAAAPSLQVLLLDDNRLNGSLPAVGLPAGAREVGLKGNALEGTLPAAIVAAAPYLDLQGNQQMCGALPELPPDELSKLRTSLTGLGGHCRVKDGVPRRTVAVVVGATVGVCCVAFFSLGAAVRAARRRPSTASETMPRGNPAPALGVPALGLPCGPGARYLVSHPSGPTAGCVDGGGDCDGSVPASPTPAAASAGAGAPKEEMPAAKGVPPKAEPVSERRPVPPPVLPPPGTAVPLSPRAAAPADLPAPAPPALPSLIAPQPAALPPVAADGNATARACSLCASPSSPPLATISCPGSRTAAGSPTAAAGIAGSPRALSLRCWTPPRIHVLRSEAGSAAGSPHCCSSCGANGGAEGGVPCSGGSGGSSRCSSPSPRAVAALTPRAAAAAAATAASGAASRSGMGSPQPGSSPAPCCAVGGE